MASANSLWEWLYTRPWWVWLTGLEVILYALCLAVLEAETQASRIIIVVVAFINAALVVWYSTYIGWRLWVGTAQASSPIEAHALLPLLSPMSKSIRPVKRDKHSVGAYVDAIMALAFTWALVCQSLLVLFPPDKHDLFALNEGASHNRWANAIEWIYTFISIFHTSETPYAASHPATKALYAVILAYQYFYVPLVVVIGVARVYDHLRDRKEVAEEHENNGHHHHHSSNTSPLQAQLPWSTLEALPLPAPGAPIGADLYGFHDFLQRQALQQSAQQQHQQQLPPTKKDVVTPQQQLWLASPPPGANIANAYPTQANTTTPSATHQAQIW